jgi:hypothetical protein
MIHVASILFACKRFLPGSKTRGLRAPEKEGFIKTAICGSVFR